MEVFQNGVLREFCFDRSRSSIGSIDWSSIREHNRWIRLFYRLASSINLSIAIKHFIYAVTTAMKLSDARYGNRFVKLVSFQNILTCHSREGDSVVNPCLEAAVIRQVSLSVYKFCRNVYLAARLIERTTPSPVYRAVVAQFGDIVLRYSIVHDHGSLMLIF